MDPTISKLVGLPLIGAIVAGAVAVTLYTLKERKTAKDEQRRKLDDQSKHIRALYAEVRFNLTDLRNFDRLSTQKDELIKKVQDDLSYVPYATIMLQSDIYKSKVDIISYLDNEYISDVVNFYGKLDAIKIQLESLSTDAYKNITPSARGNAINEIFIDVSDGIKIGKILLDKIRHSEKYSDFLTGID